MRIIRFVSGDKTYCGQPIDDHFANRIDGDLFGVFTVTKEVLPIAKLLAPLVPTDILCIGLNYRDHAAESGSTPPPNPLLFIKAGNTLNNPGDPIAVPNNSSMVDWEAELAIVIGKTARHVSKDKAMDHVFGYTAANDVTARDWQRDKNLGGGQFARGKSFDGFCPLGPAIVTKDEIPDPGKLQVRSLLNGEVMQNDTTGQMIFDVPSLIASLSSTMTLRPGSIILTGTPPGVGMGRKPPLYMKAGDKIVVEIDPIGRLENTMIHEK